MNAEKLACETVQLPMVCICRGKDGDDTRRQKADDLRARAMEILSFDSRHPATDSNFLTYAISFLHWNYSADVELAVDQWFGAYAKVRKYVECKHEDLDADCPDEPECFVYRFDDVLKVSVECDRAEDGLAALVVWFHDNRPSSEEL